MTEERQVPQITWHTDVTVQSFGCGSSFGRDISDIYRNRHFFFSCHRPALAVYTAEDTTNKLKPPTRTHTHTRCPAEDNKDHERSPADDTKRPPKK